MPNLAKQTALDVDVIETVGAIFRIENSLACIRLMGQLSLDVDNTLVPPEPNTVLGEDPSVAWLAPNEWFVIASCEIMPSFEPKLKLVLDTNQPFYVGDASDELASFILSGQRVAELLAKGGGLDFSSMEPQTCARTLLGGYHIFIHRFAAPETYRLCVARSLSRSFWEWMKIAMTAEI